jgi:glycosyltransferase involved in cell wall biosynthesis
MFVGVTNYKPNADAIRRLVNDLWPRVRRLVPDARLTIVGEGATAVADSRPDEGCIVLNFVSDLDEIYREARIALCPITGGGGTRIKVIEAAMHARPVVSTRIGAEGLSFVPGSEILLADEPGEFAQQCAALLLDPDRCVKMGRAARARALAEYSPERVVAGLVEIMTGILDLDLPGPTLQSAPYPSGELSCRHVPNHLSS